MTFDEALLTLGIDTTHDVAGARRAYLRLIKTHSPERDPAGFQRVRAAYELVRQSSYRLDQPVESAVHDETVLPLPVDALDGVRAAIWQSEDSTQQLSVAAEAARRLNTAEAYRLWLDTADEAFVDDGGRSIAQEALAAGHTEFRHVLRARFPETLTSAELDGWRAEAQENEAGDWCTLAQALAARGDAESAVDIAIRGIVAARRSAAPLNHFALTNLGLTLLAQADARHAKRYMAEFGNADAQGTSSDPLPFELLRELSAISEHLPAELRQSLAESVLSRAPQQADLALAAFVRHHPMRARMLHGRLKRDAPMLFGVYGSALPTWPRLSRPRLNLRGFFSRGWTLLFCCQAALALIRLCGRSEGRHVERPRAMGMVHVETSQLGEQTTMHTCTPTEHPLCQTARELESTVNCIETISLATQLVRLAETADRFASTNPAGFAAIKQLRDQAYGRCGGKADRP